MKTPEDRINLLLEEHLGVDPKEIKPETNLRDDLDADSLDRIEMLMAAEDEFQIEISNQDGARIKTVADVYALVRRLTAS